MPTIMSVWQHSTHRTCYIREAIPEDLQQVAGRKTYKRSLGTTKLAEARDRYSDALVVFRAYLDTLRNGPRTLSAQQVEALVGLWYRRSLDYWSRNPGTVANWEAAFMALPAGDHPDDAAARTQIVDPIVSGLLDDEGLKVDEGTREALRDRLFVRLLDLFNRMEFRAARDFSPDPTLSQFPEWSNPGAAKSPQSPVLTFSAMLERWSKEVKRKPETVKETHAIVARFAAFIGHDDASLVETADVERWRDALMASGTLKQKTVQAKYLAAVSAVYSASQGKGTGRLQANPVKGAWFKGSVFADSVEIDAYTRQELAAILRAARAETSPELRWLPWLMAYTGTRFREAAQCIAADIKERDGLVYLDINADHPWKRIKGKPGMASASVRDIPLHPALIVEGFADYVKTLSAADFLFPRIKPRTDGRSNEGRPVNTARCWIAAQALNGTTGGDQLRRGVKLKTNPTHSFRHAFEDALREATEDNELRLDIAGRADGSSARGYGEGHALRRKHEVIERIAPIL